VQYGTPVDDPNEIEIAPVGGPPSADQVLDRYIQAPGGAQQLANLASFVAKGTHSGYDTEQVKVPVEVFANAPGQGGRDSVFSSAGQASLHFSQWRVGSSTIDDRDVQVVQGTSAGQLPVKLYFDGETGLLVRLVRYTESPVGRNPTQIDYAARVSGMTRRTSERSGLISK